MRKVLFVLVSVAVLLSGCGNKTILTENDVPQLPRESVLGGGSSPPTQISPYGSNVAWAYLYNDVLNVWVADMGLIKSDARPVTKSTDRPITKFWWDYTGNIIYLKDDGGNENYHLHRVNITTLADVDLTPGKGFRVGIEQLSTSHKKEIAITINDRDPEKFDIKKINLETGKTELIYKNTENIIACVDYEFKIRVGERETPDGGKELLRFRDGKWEVMETVTLDDNRFTYFLNIDRSDQFAYLMTSLGRDTAAVYRVDINTWHKELVAANDKSDTNDYIFWGSTQDLSAVSFFYDKQTWQAVDPAIKPDLNYLSKLHDGKWLVESISLDDDLWIVSYESDVSPGDTYLYYRNQKSAHKILSKDGWIPKDAHLAKMNPRVIKSRDGIDLVSYLSLPPWTDNDENGVPDKPVPMVLMVHGGPASRVYWGYNSVHQFFANRGYAVLDVNFRGSWGFGKRFLNLGNGQWGAKMNDDLIDAVDWAIGQSIAIPDKVAIYGGSYGGYAVLAGMTFTPDKFACGIDYVGISNLMTFMRSMPSYWKPSYESWIRQVGGDPDTEAGREFLASRSPINFADKIKKPLLVAHGLNDQRVKIAESEQIVKAVRKNNVPVTFCVYPDEGHGFLKWKNQMTFYAIVENFLSKYLGGRAQTIEDSGSSIQIR